MKRIIGSQGRNTLGTLRVRVRITGNFSEQIKVQSLRMNWSYLGTYWMLGLERACIPNSVNSHAVVKWYHANGEAAVIAYDWIKC